jgi:type VI secretion system protein ImpC
VSLKIKVLNVSKKELLRDLQRAPEFDQSALFKKVYEEEYGVFGGTRSAPWSATTTSTRRPGHRAAREGLAGGGRRARAVPDGGVAPDVQPGQLRQLDAPRDLAKVFDSTEYAKWKAFRQTEDSRYVALTAPRMLLREPYGSATVPIESFNYEERVDGSDHEAYLWGNAAYALGGQREQGVRALRLVRLDPRRRERRAGRRGCRCTTSAPRPASWR